MLGSATGFLHSMLTCSHDFLCLALALQNTPARVLFRTSCFTASMRSTVSMTAWAAQ